MKKSRNPIPSKSKYLRPSQLESEYGLSRWFMYSTPPLGFPKVFRVGRCLLVSREAIEKYIERQISHANEIPTPKAPASRLTQ